MISTAPLWTAQEVAVATGGHFSQPWYADGLQVDSREVLIGDLFIALKGEALDGHDYVADAFARGAVAAIVSRTRMAGVSSDDPRLMLVDDTDIALANLARAARVRAPAHVVAVTGSVGKTTVTHGLRELMADQTETHASVRSFNNHVGVPLSLARMPRDTRFAVFEAGMSQPGEIAHRSDMITPNTAVISTVGTAHRGNFEDEKAIAKEKSDILLGMATGGTAIIGIDHVHADYLIDRAKALGHQVMTVSALGAADVSIAQHYSDAGQSRIRANICGSVIDYALPHVGNIWAFNSLLMLASAYVAGGDLAVAAGSLSAVQPPAGRGRIYNLDWPMGSVTLIDDSYNANPQSVAAALDHLELVSAQRPESGKRVAILGDMLDLGAHAESAHRDMAPRCTDAGVDLLITLGDLANITGTSAQARHIHARSIVQARQILMQYIGGNDVVLVKGSNASGLSRLADMLKNTDRFSLDWPQVAEA